jgi:sulfur carrier protein ThiS
MEVYLDGKKIKLDKKFSKLSEILEELKISKQIAIIKVNGKITPSQNSIKPNSKIEIIRVVFGG